MWKYATRRVLTMIPILIGVSMVVFLLVASLPGDAVDAHAGGNITAEKIAQNKALLGLDKPIPETYANWVSHAIKGDFGISISYKIPVTEVIGKFVCSVHTETILRDSMRRYFGDQAIFNF